MEKVCGRQIPYPHPTKLPEERMKEVEEDEKK